MPTGGYLLKNADGTVSSLNLAAGTATAGQAPLYFTLGSAVVLTAPVAGVMEMDANGIAYYTHATSERGIIDTEQFISLTAAYTLTSQTAPQKLFNSSTNGAVTVASNTSFIFECLFSLSSMSGTAGNFGFALGGGATITAQFWKVISQKLATITTSASHPTGYATAASTTISAVNSFTNGYALINGSFRVSTGGTIIPQVSLTQAAAAVVGVNSYFKIIPMGTDTITNIGNWS